MKSEIVIATRRSALAMAQAHTAQGLLQLAHPDRVVKLLPMTTQGDEKVKWSLSKEGGKGLFTTDLEHAVIEGEADYAVHSGKDLPTEFLDGLEISGYLPREDPRDVLVFREDLKGDPQFIATGSPRRRHQLKLLFPGAKWTEIRGNVETRMRKISDGYADATVLAAAGLNRLGIKGYPGLSFFTLPVDDCVPAAAQGAIAIQGRTGESELWDSCICKKTTADVLIERRALQALGGGCHSASAAFVEKGTLYLYDHVVGRHETDCSVTGFDPEAWIKQLRHQHFSV
tara:strand:- start:7275 stop:8132 length:858 start_codon:yes stop_codon:yes gene_type:complete